MSKKVDFVLETEYVKIIETIENLKTLEQTIVRL